MPETEIRDGFAIKAVTAGDYTSAGYVLDVDFDTQAEARQWILDVLQTRSGDEPGEAWLDMEDGGVLRLAAVAALKIVDARVEREVVRESRRQRREHLELPTT